MTPEEIDKHNELYTASTDVLKNYIELEGRAPGHVEPSAEQVKIAILQLETVLRMKPDNASAMWMLGHVYVKDEKWEEAIAILKQSFQSHPYSDTLRTLAICGFNTGDYELALQCNELACKMEPEDFGLQVNRASSYMFAGQPKRALQILEQYAEQLKDDEIASLLSRLLKQVIAGVRPCPSKASELPLLQEISDAADEK